MECFGAVPVLAAAAGFLALIAAVAGVVTALIMLLVLRQLFWLESELTELQKATMLRTTTLLSTIRALHDILRPVAKR